MRVIQSTPHGAQRVVGRSNVPTAQLVVTAIVQRRPDAAASAPCRRLAASGAVGLGAQQCRRQRRSTLHRLKAVNGAGAVTSEDDVVRVATIGDLVTIHFTCTDDNGEVLETSRGEGEGPITFELGAGEIMGNRLFQGFDEAVRGLAVGQTTVIEASGGEWRQELLFTVPRDHPEVERLEGRYKNQGGLQKDMLVELANGQLAAIVELTDSAVRIDANNMMAGKKLTFQLELLGIDKPQPTTAAAA